ncbi:unnamed protein product [Cyclocybe aegerita]|uniref:Fe2OG dioxygenase domain-containing protein n=1 Tax=Cyclocybe aegerita TaxID=1973307 RepID=A0A8S0WML6_CYCAE|nr:unnamed protein product [Cyclocybe aegerita]
MITALNHLPTFTNFQEAVKGIQRVSYCTGAIPLDANTSTVFYRIDGKTFHVDFAKASTEDLKLLADSCQPATFGVGQKDVFDEIYRKAGKMDSANFATQFHPYTCGVVDAIRNTMLSPQDTDRDLKVEMYKLNVYGPGAFFKAHVDTPRSDTMFGSLVVVLPTKHEGGSLVFRHRGTEWTFDTAQAVSTGAPPELRAAFVAFFGDVEHEVSVVTSGYRVTLTYNLYYEDSHPRREEPAPSPLPVPTLSALLADPNFLPEGGLIGFGLFHKYAFRAEYPRTKLSEIERNLKGLDAAVRNVCKSLHLAASLKTLYRDSMRKAEFCLANEFADLGYPAEDGLLWYLMEADGAILAYGYGEEKRLKGDNPADIPSVVWITEASAVNKFELTYIDAFGNKAGLGCAYMQLCLIAKVGPVGKRATGEQP